MKRNIILSLQFYFLVFSIYAQEKYSNVWIFGHIPNEPKNYFGGSKLDFGTNNPKVNYFSINSSIFDCSVISNSDGNLEIYSNACEIFDSNNRIILNGNHISHGEFYNSYCLDPIDPFYPTKSSGIILPGFDSNSNYFIHIDVQPIYWNNNLYLAKIIKSNSNELFVDHVDVLARVNLSEGIQAIRHGNGRDWWIISHSNDSSLFVRYLLTPDKLVGPFIQDIGDKWNGNGEIVQSAFSPDGSMYAIASEFNGASLYNFDRCEGVLTNYRKLDSPPNEKRFDPLGVCFSPNSKILYLASNSLLFQYDLTIANNSNSYTVIGIIDSFRLPYIFATSFYQLTLGPDNRIYCNTTNETNVLHVIQYPDKLGKDCGLKQHDILLPSTYFQAMPNFPMFRVYDLEGSPCDTLGINKLPIANFRFTQDTLDYLNFEFTDLSLFNVTQWNWDFGDNASLNNISKIQSPIHEFSKSGTFHVCLTVKNIHGYDSYCHFINIGNITASKSLDIDIQKEVVLTPNPCKDYLIIQVNNYNPERMKAIFYNSIGEIVSVNKILSGRNTIDINNFIKGFYVVNIFNNEVLVRQSKVLKL